MIKSVDELKELVLWAKQHKIKAFKVGDIQIELSEMAFLSDITVPAETSSEVPVTQENEDDLLYFSAR